VDIIIRIPTTAKPPNRSVLLTAGVTATADAKEAADVDGV
jgi:hypothetical protein